MRMLRSILQFSPRGYNRHIISASLDGLFQKFNSLFLKFLVVLMAFFVSIPNVQAQGVSNEAEWSENGFSLKKIVSNTSIPSGVNFSYTILFTVPAGQTSVYIEDIVPPALQVVSVPPPSNVSGVPPLINISGNTVSYSLTGLPAGTAHSGSFTIVVRFPAGITCPGTSARNRAGILVNDKWQYTPFVSTAATADDPWKANKAILNGAVVNPTGGSCGYLMNAGSTVTYRLSINKNSPYWGNTNGQLSASNAVVTDVLPTGAQMLSYTGNAGTASQTGNTITWNIGNLDATVAYAYYYIDVQIEYPAATFPNGTIVNNQFTLNADICLQQVSHISNQTCIEVTEVVANQSAFFRKYIYLTNRVPGCDGYYRVAFYNNGNTPLSAFNIDDVVPAGITVNSVLVSGGTAGNMLDLYADGSMVLSNVIGNATYNFTSPPSTLQLQMNGTLPVNSWINMYIYFTVDNTPTGTQIENCASFNALSN